MSKAGKLRCAVYTRKSIEKGLDMEFNTLHAQREACENYIKSQAGKGWVCLPEHYDDGGFSGGNVNRPALQKLRADIEAGKIDVVVVYKIDRLSRSLLDFADLQTFFQKHNISFCSVTQEINTSTSAGRMMLNILMSFSQHEREIIAERIKDKVVASKKRGMWLGGYVPFGYFAENKKLYPHSQEAPIVKRIFERFVETQSPKLIALELNQEGILPRTGNLWKVPYISRIISNRIYVGEIFYNDEIIPGIHKAIIDRDIWERAQEIVKSNNPYDRAGGAAELIVPLKGLLRCGHCGGAMKPVFTTRGKKRYYYYYCDQDTKRAERCCPIGKIGSATVEDAVKEQTRKIFETTYFQEQIAAQTGITINELMELFNDTFWQESNPQELNRLYSELFEKIILKENQIIYEIKTSGVQALIEGVTNEYQ